jgi:hypothetical protein
MESIRREHGKIKEKNSVEEARVESLFEKLKSNKSSTIVQENIEKDEIPLEECGADIDEIFIKLYGQPSQTRSAEEQREIINKENGRRKRAERISSENTDDGKIVEENGNTMTEMVLIDEDIIEQDSVTLEQAEVDWDNLFEDLDSSENVETPPNGSDSFLSCTIV